MRMPGMTILILLMGMVFVSAVAVVQARHDSRQLFVELQALQQQRNEMDVQWERMLLEQATLGTYSGIEASAREKLGMIVPTLENSVLVGQ